MKFLFDDEVFSLRRCVLPATVRTAAPTSARFW